MGKHLKDETADYYSESHIQVLFPGGTTTAKFDVHMIDDLNIITVENTERFRVSIDPLSLPYGVVLGPVPSAEVNIVDIDGKQYNLCAYMSYLIFFLNQAHQPKANVHLVS